MFLIFERAVWITIGCQNTHNLRNVLSATRWWQNDQFWKLYSFLTFKVPIERILNKFELTILEKLKMENAPFLIFNPNFWPLGGAKSKFRPFQVFNWVQFSEFTKCHTSEMSRLRRAFGTPIPRHRQYETLTLDTCRFGSQAVVNAFRVVQITSQSTIK